MIDQLFEAEKQPTPRVRRLRPATTETVVVKSPCTVWLVGMHRGVLSTRTLTACAWNVIGVFDTEEQAVEACTADKDFILPMTFNELLPNAANWSGAYYPHQRNSTT